MTKDEIIRMARDAGSIDSEEVIDTVWNAFSAVEREACALVAEDWDNDSADPRDIAAVIRARGTND